MRRLDGNTCAASRYLPFPSIYLTHKGTSTDRGGMPTDTKPHKAREAKKRHARLRKSGTIADMQRELWRTILCAKDVLLDASADSATTLKATPEK